MAIALDSNNDMFADNGAIRRVVGGAQVVQHVRSRLLTYYGEWFLDTTAGVPYFEEVFIKPANLANVESLIKQTILQTEGVATLDSFELIFESNTRKLEVIFSATTDDGTAINSTVNLNI